MSPASPDRLSQQIPQQAAQHPIGSNIIGELHNGGGKQAR
jgi:hypothetical protein